MAAPGMLLIPVIMENLEKMAWMKRIKPLHGWMQVMLCGVSLTFMVPTACSMFPQKSSLSIDRLEPELQAVIRERGGGIDRVYFNKGL